MRYLKRLIPALLIVTAYCAACGRQVQTQEPTATPFQFITATPRPTVTPMPGTTSTRTPIPFVPTATPTLKPAFTFTPSPSPTETPTPEFTVTILGICDHRPEGVFLEVYSSDPGLPTSLGCPTSPPDSEDPPTTWPTRAIYQSLERGHLLWLSNIGWYEGKVIYVMLDDLTYTRHDDTFDPDVDPSSGRYRPPEGLYEPIDALGKIWRTVPGLKEQLGYGTAPPVVVDTRMQMFQYGEMVHIPQVEVVFVFKRGEPNTWALYTLEPEE